MPDVDIKDVKPVVNPPLDVGEPIVWFWLIAAVAIFLLIVYLFLRFRRKRVKPDEPVPLRPAWELALERLEELKQKNYPAQGMFKIFYSGLSDIVRHYLEDRFNIRAPEMTTEEFLLSVRLSAQLTSEHKQLLRDFLNGCDLVKFAKHEPSAQEAMVNLELARKLIMETRDGI